MQRILLIGSAISPSCGRRSVSGFTYRQWPVWCISSTSIPCAFGVRDHPARATFFWY